MTEQRATYTSLGDHEKIDLLSPVNVVSAAISPLSFPMHHSRTGTGHVQQRYKLLVEGSIQICRVPHAKNLIEKIRFSRFLRRWEEHQIGLDNDEISSNTVRINLQCNSSLLRLFRKRDTWIDPFYIHRWKISLFGRNQR